MAYNPTSMKVSRITRSLRQKDVAIMLGITPEAYSRKETGASNFTLLEANKLRDDLNLSEKETMDIFFGGNLTKTESKEGGTL